MGFEVGSILEGKVTGITKFGAFVSLPENRSGLVHISEIAYSYVNDIHDHLSEGQTVTVKVIGIDDNNRIIIHKRQCPIATQLKTSFGNRLLAVKWETGKALSFPVNVYIKGIDDIGVLNKVTEIISQQLNVNIRKLAVESNDGIFEGRIQLFVHDVDDVNTICNKLKKIDNIKRVTRIENFNDASAD